jgi:hypothetical protein
VCFPFVEYFPVRDTAAPRVRVSLSALARAGRVDAAANTAETSPGAAERRRVLAIMFSPHRLWDPRSRF